MEANNHQYKIANHHQAYFSIYLAGMFSKTWAGLEGQTTKPTLHRLN